MRDLATSVITKSLGPVMTLVTTAYIFHLFEDANGDQLAGFFSIIAIIAYVTNGIFSPVLFNQRRKAICFYGKTVSVRIFVISVVFIKVIIFVLSLLFVMLSAGYLDYASLHILIIAPFVVCTVMISDIMRYEGRAFVAELFSWNGFYGSVLRQAFFLSTLVLLDNSLPSYLVDQSELTILICYGVSNIALSFVMAIGFFPNFNNDNENYSFDRIFKDVKIRLKANLEFVTVQTVQTQFFLIAVVGAFGFEHLRFALFNVAQLRSFCMQPLNFIGSYMPVMMSRLESDTERLSQYFYYIRFFSFGCTLLCLILVLALAGPLGLEFLRLSNWGMVAVAVVPILVLSALGPVTRVVALTNGLDRVNESSSIRLLAWFLALLIAIQIGRVEGFIACLGLSFALNQWVCHRALPKYFHVTRAN